VYLRYLGSFDALSLFALVTFLNIGRWLHATHLIQVLYRVKEAWLHKCGEFHASLEFRRGGKAETKISVMSSR
jgi:hypothetical protein